MTGKHDAVLTSNLNRL